MVVQAGQLRSAVASLVLEAGEVFFQAALAEGEGEVSAGAFEDASEHVCVAPKAAGEGVRVVYGDE